MNEAIKAILSELPSYLYTLIRLLIGPAKFVSSIEFKEETKLINITRGLTFACISYILSEVLASINLTSHLTPNVSLFSYYAISFAITVIVFVGFLLALAAAIRLAGVSPALDRLIVIHAYYFGVFMVMMRALGSMAEGWLNFGARWRNSGQDAAGLEPAVYFLLVFAAGILFVWGLFAWGGYARVCSLTARRSTGGLVLSWLFAVPVLLLSFFMSEAWLPIVRSASASTPSAQTPQALPALPMRSQAVSANDSPKYSGPLIGAWASHGVTVEESYLFREDGSFRNVLVASGQILQGNVVCEGAYTIKGNVLTLRVKQAGGQGTPACNAVEEFRFYFEDRNTLVLEGESGGTYDRVK